MYFYNTCIYVHTYTYIFPHISPMYKYTGIHTLAGIHTHTYNVYVCAYIHACLYR